MSPSRQALSELVEFSRHWDMVIEYRPWPNNVSDALIAHSTPLVEIWQ